MDIIILQVQYNTMFKIFNLKNLISITYVLMYTNREMLNFYDLTFFMT